MTVPSEKMVSRWVAIVVWLAMVVAGVFQIRARHWNAETWLAWVILWLLVGMAFVLTHRSVSKYPSDGA